MKHHKQNKECKTWANVSSLDSWDLTNWSYCCLIFLWAALEDDVNGYKHTNFSLLSLFSSTLTKFFFPFLVFFLFFFPSLISSSPSEQPEWDPVSTGENRVTHSLEMDGETSKRSDWDNWVEFNWFEFWVLFEILARDCLRLKMEV